jgi:hypothetical protein
MLYLTWKFPEHYSRAPPLLNSKPKMFYLALSHTKPQATKVIILTCLIQAAIPLQKKIIISMFWAFVGVNSRKWSSVNSYLTFSYHQAMGLKECQ